MQVTAEDLSDLVRGAWETTLASAAPIPAQPRTDQWLVSSIEIHGGWNGSLVVSCPLEHALVAGQQLFGGADEDPLVCANETVKELANIIAGNVAPLLGENCRLGFPRTGPRGSDPTANPEGESVRCNSSEVPLVVDLVPGQRPG